MNEFVYLQNLNVIVLVATMIQCILNLVNVHTAQLKIEIVMKEVGTELVETDDKYHLLVPLYNKWYNATMMNSTGVLSGEDYENLVSYCKENKLETLHFFLDLIDCYTESAKAGIRKDNCVGHCLCMLNEVFPNTLVFDGYVGFKLMQKKWKDSATIILRNKHVETK